MRLDPSAALPLADTAAASPSQRGRVLAGRYRILRFLGRGAAKAVYLAHDERLDREVALSLVDGSAHDRLIQARLEREAQVMGRLGDHPHIVTIHDIGEADGVACIVTRYMAGGTLADRVAAAPRRRLPIAEAVRVTAEIADALAYAHERGIAHLDVKPLNILLDGEGRAGLGDFGIAVSERHGDTRRTGGEPVGTALYMSPEQASGETVGSPSDVYSLGVTLYELLCGAPPFVAEHAVTVMGMHRSAAPGRPRELDPEIPTALEELTLALLAKRPADRPTAAHVVSELRQLSARDAQPLRSDLLGREAELQILHEALGDSLAGRGVCVSVAGPPGIGKTRIAQALAATAEAAGAAVLWGRCAAEPGAPPYWPWVQVVRALPAAVRRLPALPPELADLLPERRRADAVAHADDPDAARFALLEAATTFFGRSARRRPLVIVLDDLQFADQPSLQLLTHLARHAAGASVLIVATYRTGAARRRGPLREALGELAASPAHRRLILGGLREPEVARVLEATLGSADAELARALSRQTRGNPLFVREFALMLAAERRAPGLQSPGAAPGTQPRAGALALIPPHVAEVIRRRVAGLPEETAALLDVASVQGVEFDVRATAEGAGVPLDRVWSAVELGREEDLVEPLADSLGGRWCFTHGIIRDVIAEDLDALRRARIQLAVGRALEERRVGGAAIEAAVLADHFAGAAVVLGVEGERAVAYCREAAERALALQSFAEAVHHWARAFAALETLPDATNEQRCDILLAQADAETLAGDADAGKHIFLRAAALARHTDGADSFVRAALGYAEWGKYGATHPRAIALLEEALERLDDADSEARAAVLSRLAVRHDPITHQAERERLAGEAVAMARRLGSDRALATALSLQMLVEWRHERRALRRDAAEAAIALVSTAGLHPGALWAHVIRFTDALADGAIAAADAELECYAEVAEQLRQPYYRWYELVLRATRLGFTGAHVEAAQCSEEAHAVIARLESDCAQERTVQRLMLWRTTGRPDTGLADDLHRFAARYPRLGVWRAMAAALDAEQGATARARTALIESLPEHGGPGDAGDPDRLSMLAFLADACVVIGDVARARRLYDALVPYSDLNVVTERGWAGWGAVARQLGRLAALVGDEAAAVGHFDRALELNRSWGARPWVLRTQLDRAGALPHAPERSEWLAEAGALAAALDVEPPGLRG